MTLSTTNETLPAFTKLELRTAYGPVYRDVATTPPRECLPEEIPVIDVSRMFGDLKQRKSLATEIRAAAENTGFFYIKNHGIDEATIQTAHEQAKVFFHRPESEKQNVSRKKSKFFNGWLQRQTGRSSPSEALDNMEQFGWCYDPKYDPESKDLNAIPEDVKSGLQGEDFVWEGTEHLPNFKNDCIRYWQANLQLARRLLKIFALSLDLPEDYFDKVTTYPGSDSAFNFYPGVSSESIAKRSEDIGLGSHTDLQCFTLLWQDMNGGLQVLSKDGHWLKATTIPGTLVVNIGDYLMRLTNDRFKSTVHRVYNRSTADRYSMPFFFGFNFNETCGVLPSCVSAEEPAKYEPISCGESIRLRFKQIEESTTVA
ncbi:hypothetical protein N0V83_007471 [Neocucurbitaria cava]|uniref:Fe2OG dioxygenase domain-containing protein n=1 Tax=Neocucurbitaria cava TaxID=798079 RepID=A0A9W8Y3F2_9PLEO|nr:hypothetical protein N0V83_007471 [Neocucurbitaria cava]